MAFAPPAIVEGAPRTPNPFGLLTALTLREPPVAQDRFENGVQWEYLSCDPLGVVGDPSCGPSGTTQAPGLPKQFSQRVPVGDATPFTVYGTYKCSPVGRSPAEAENRALEDLMTKEEAAAERALWTGAQGNKPSLAGASDLSPASPGGPALAVALLENYLAENYGAQGVIHISRGGATVLAAAGLVRTSGSSMRTGVGTPVAAGTGYPNTDPSGVPADPGTFWAYVTPAMFGYRSAVFTSSDQPSDLLDTEQNDLFAVAERTYVLGFDECGIAAVQFVQSSSGGSSGGFGTSGFGT